MKDQPSWLLRFRQNSWNVFLQIHEGDWNIISKSDKTAKIHIYCMQILSFELMVTMAQWLYLTHLSLSLSLSVSCLYRADKSQCSVQCTVQCTVQCQCSVHRCLHLQSQCGSSVARSTKGYTDILCGARDRPALWQLLELIISAD